jgi:hypothetical protein
MTYKTTTTAYYVLASPAPVMSPIAKLATTSASDGLQEGCSSRPKSKSARVYGLEWVNAWRQLGVNNRHNAMWKAIEVEHLYMYCFLVEEDHI